MKKKNKNLPTLESSLGGGYLESRKKPRLEKFIKNKKQKQILIGTIIGLIILIGGITLYHTFAMYKTEKSFDVIKGIVPNFGLKQGDITLAYTVDGSTNSSSFPNKQDGYIAESITCENSVQAEWDNISWSLKNIKNPQKSSKISCTVNFNRSYKDTILNGADPIIDGDLVPVKIDKATGKVTKAKVTEEWYNYKNKEWANAVILKDGVGVPNDNAEINENDIESYFVWIPKYSYKLFDNNMGNYTAWTTIDATKQNKAIEIEFGLTNTTNDESKVNHKECATPMLANKVQGESGGNGECSPGEWMTHPAFLAFDTKGLWVGKFETSDAGGNKVQIKPNATSWRYILLGDAFKYSKSYKDDLLSHLTKNTEWGAITYLTQSIYGRCTSSNECTEVVINGNANYTTGYSNTNIPYTTDTSVASSTNGNYTGIYDMNGGAWEMLANFVKNTNGKAIINSTALTDADLTDLRYYDIYEYGTSETTFNHRILGDATGEIGPFASRLSSMFSDYGAFPNSSSPFNYRGGDRTNAAYAGIFSFAPNSKQNTDNLGFRIVLAPQ